MIPWLRSNWYFIGEFKVGLSHFHPYLFNMGPYGENSLSASGGQMDGATSNIKWGMNIKSHVTIKNMTVNLTVDNLERSNQGQDCFDWLIIQFLAHIDPLLLLNNYRKHHIRILFIS